MDITLTSEKYMENIVNFMSRWKSMYHDYIIRVFLYSAFAFIFGSMSYNALVTYWGNANKILTLVTAAGMMGFSIFIVMVAVLGAIDSKNREWKAFGYRKDEIADALMEIENILYRKKLKYHKTGSKWNFFRFQRYIEIFQIEDWSIRCYFYKSKKWPPYEALIVEIGPIKENTKTLIEEIKREFDNRLTRFYLE